MILITGGARSGKSAFAESYAAYLGRAGIYIATSQIIDDEMERRIELHRAKRRASNFNWTTYEEPYDLVERIHRINEEVLEASKSDLNDEFAEKTQPIVLIDCMTIWLTNWLLSYERAETEYKHQDEAQQRILDKINQLVEAVSTFQGKILLVTNEVGNSIIPEHRLGRRLRDLIGLMNQRLAERSEQVILVTAGIPIELKSRAFKFDV